MSPNKTEFTAHLEAEITPGKNLLYCGTFQIVWNQLIDEMNKAPITLTGNPQTAQVLNKRLFEKNEIDEGCYLAMVGTGREGIVDKIKQSLKEKFDCEPGILLDPDADILSYAYLEKNLPFDKVFDVFDEPLSFNNDGAVQSFGIYETVDAIDQVEVFDYINPDDFIIKLRASLKIDEELAFGAPAKEPRITDDIILAKVSPGVTLFETVSAVFGRIEKEEEQLAKRKNPNNPKAWERIRHYLLRLNPESERVQIPKIDFNILHNYTELEGQTISSGNLTGMRIDGAIQSIKFKLDETGAVLKSEALIEMHYGMSEEEPRRFIFDKPFLFCLREKGAQHPYLVLWIENSELLVKA